MGFDLEYKQKIYNAISIIHHIKMVTLDNRLVNVGKFGGDLERGGKNYERAKQGLELIPQAKSRLEEKLKEYTGFNDLNLPKKPTDTEIQRGEVKFIIRSQRSTKRPPYKTAVEGLENYLLGVPFLISQDMEVDGVLQQGRLTYIGTGKLLDAFKIIVGGIFNPGVNHKIKYEVIGKLAEEGVIDELVLKEVSKYAALTEENFNDYVRISRLEPILKVYEKAYEKSLPKGTKKPKKTTPITSKTAYTTIKSKAEGPDWAYIVKTLIAVPTEPDSRGELNILNDPRISKAEKERMLPYYNLIYGGTRYIRILYVSIQSVYQRIQDLKEERVIEANRLKVEPKIIV